MSAPYALSPGVLAAIDGDWIIFLDLNANRYLAASVSAAGAIEELRNLRTCEEDFNVDAALALREGGLIRDRLAFANAEAAAPAAVLVGKANATIAAPAPLQFLCATHWARTIVAQGAMARAAAQLGAWKASALRAGASSAREAIDRFDRMRPWHPARYVCLFNALALMRFLLARGASADFVIGVRARPFFAHAWVELDGEVIDDGGEDCTATTEIFRI